MPGFKQTSYNVITKHMKQLHSWALQPHNLLYTVQRSLYSTEYIVYFIEDFIMC